jgi:MSHA biogenesis protein MshL
MLLSINFKHICIRWIILVSMLVVMIILGSGCHPVPPREPIAMKQIQGELWSGIHADKKVVRKEHLPRSVSHALLPSMAPQLPPIDNVLRHRFNVTANKIPARDFFMSLIEGTPYNVVVDPKVTGTVSLNLKNVTIEEALEAVHDVYGYEYKPTSYGFEVLPPQLQTHIFNVNYLDVQRNGKSLTQVNSGTLSDKVGGFTTTSSTNNTLTTNSLAGTGQAISNSSVDTRSESHFWKTLQKSLHTMVSLENGRSVIVNGQAGVVIVHAYPAEIQTVARYLDQLQNNMTRQVILEAKILEVQLNDQFQSGVNWNLLGRINGFDPVTQTPIINTDVSGLAQDGLLTFDHTDLKDFNGIIALNKKGNFGALIKLLQTQGNVQVLSNPRISTVNNQKAVIKVGQDEFFVTGVSTTSIVAGSATIPTQDVALTPFFSGVTLDVTPQISSNGEVILHIHPSITTVKDQQKNILLATPLQLPLALSTVRESDNVVRAQSGQVIVIGGLMQTITSEEIGGVPALSKIPFLGAAFRRTQQVSRKTELVILLKPIVVENKTWTTELQAADQIFSKVDRGFHAGGLPEVFGTEGERRQPCT